MLVWYVGGNMHGSFHTEQTRYARLCEKVTNHKPFYMRNEIMSSGKGGIPWFKQILLRLPKKT
jgi:hypothetical protein